jgi:hypothetical protein
MLTRPQRPVDLPLRLDDADASPTLHRANHSNNPLKKKERQASPVIAQQTSGTVKEQASPDNPIVCIAGDRAAVGNPPDLF